MPEIKIFPPVYTKELPWRTFGLQWRKGEGFHVTRPPMVFQFPPTLLDLKFVTKRSGEQKEPADG